MNESMIPDNHTTANADGDGDGDANSIDWEENDAAENEQSNIVYNDEVVNEENVEPSNIVNNDEVVNEPSSSVNSDEEHESSPSTTNTEANAYPSRAVSSSQHSIVSPSEVTSHSHSRRKPSSMVSESLLRTTTSRVMDSKGAERIRASREASSSSSHYSEVRSISRDTTVSESLLKTTTARVIDNKEAEKIRNKGDPSSSSDVKSINRDAVVAPPSEHLTRPTQARIYDELHLQSRKGMIKHEDDPFWEIRKPLAMANNKKFNQVESKLLEPTTATIFYQRKKHTESPEKAPHSPESTLLRAGSIASTPTTNGGGGGGGGVTTPSVSVRHINPDSHLLTQTTNSVIKNVKITLPSPPPPALELPTQSSALGHYSSIHPCIYLLHPSIYVSIHPSIYASIHLFIHPSIHLCIYSSIHLCIHLCIYLFIIHPSMHLFIYSTLGPRGVESKLMQNTAAIARGKWKSREQQELERFNNRHKSPYKVLLSSSSPSSS